MVKIENEGLIDFLTLFLLFSGYSCLVLSFMGYSILIVLASLILAGREIIISSILNRRRGF